MLLTFIRLDGDIGMKVVLDEEALRALELYDRLQRGEEIEMEIELENDGQFASLHEASKDKRPGNVLRLRGDGKAEVVFPCET